MEVDEPEEAEEELLENAAIEMPAAADADMPAAPDAPTNPEPEIAFDQMSEDELLAGIEGLVPPEKSDDY